MIAERIIYWIIISFSCSFRSENKMSTNKSKPIRFNKYYIGTEWKRRKKTADKGNILVSDKANSIINTRIRVQSCAIFHDLLNVLTS